MVLIRQTFDEVGTKQGVGFGFIVQEAIAGERTIQVRQLIYADMLPTKPADFPALFAYWSLTLWVPTIPESISGRPGNPARFKLGSITHASLGATSDLTFWNWQWQTFEQQGCLCRPTILGYPKTISEIPGYSDAGLITPASRLNNNVGFKPQNAIATSPNSFAGNTECRIYPEDEGMLYNATITYVAFWGTETSYASYSPYIFNK